METSEKRIEHIRNCHESFVKNCGIQYHTFAGMWLNGPKYFLHQDSDSAKFLRRECITMYMQFSNILDDCDRYGVTDEDLEYRFCLRDMRKFLDTYKDWMKGQFTKPTSIL